MLVAGSSESPAESKSMLSLWLSTPSWPLRHHTNITRWWKGPMSGSLKLPGKKVRKCSRRSSASGTRKTEFWSQYLQISAYHFIVKELYSVGCFHIVLRRALGVPDAFQGPSQGKRRDVEKEEASPPEYPPSCPSFSSSV